MEVEIMKVKFPNHNWPEVTDFIITLIATPGFYATKLLMYKYLRPFFQKHIKQKYQGEVRLDKIEKSCRNTYKSVCFLIFTVLGYLVVTEMPYCPPSMLGTGDISLLYAEHPYNYKPALLTFYYLFELGYHLEGGIYHAL